MKTLEEIEKKKEYLKSYEKVVRKMERSEIRIAEIRKNRLSISVKYNDMPHGHGSNDLSSYAAALDAEERKYMKARYKRVKLCREITDKIERLENEDEKDVLMYRYINLMKWENICIKMDIGWSHVHRIHNRALYNFKINV